jgi:arsenite methyltransferase
MRDEPEFQPRGDLIGLMRRFVKRQFISGPRRDRRQQPDSVIRELKLRDGQRVADIGAGSGYFTLRLARAVGPDGKVFAVDTDDDMLTMVQQAAAREGVGVGVVLIKARDALLALPEQVDLFFLSHSYHHLPEVVDYMRRARPLLKPSGRVAIIEGRPGGWLSRLFRHVSEPALVRQQMTEAGYEVVERHTFLADDSFQIFATRMENGR